MILETLNSHVKKNKVGPHTKNHINSKWIQNLNLSEHVNLRPYKILKKNVGANLHDIEIGISFLAIIVKHNRWGKN